MSIFHLKSGTAKFGLISILISVLHFFEDAALVLLGRYTSINIIIAVLAGILFSLSVAALLKLNIVKKYLL